MPPPKRSDQSIKILSNNNLTKNTVDSLLGRAIKFRPSRYVDEKLDLFKRKFAPVNQSSTTATTTNGSANRSTAVGYGHQQQQADDTMSTHDAYGFERPSKWLFPRDRLEPSWTKVRLIGAGLTDINNQTSALNAVLQCLSYTPLLSNYLVSKWHSANCTVQDYCFVCALEDHVKECLSGSGQRIAPRQFVGKLKKMKSGSNKDAHSIWSFFMNQMQHFLLLEKGSQDTLTQETTALYQIYYGHLQNRMECSTCQNQDQDKTSSEYQYPGFLDLTLDINQGNTVERCLSRQLQTMGLESSNECEKCKSTVKEYYTIYQPPRVLTIHLDRFDKNGNKNTKSIKFNENMDISRFMTFSQLENDKKPITQYQLCGLITHQGTSSIHGGRFVAYVKSSNGMWYCLDNESVQQVNNKRLLDQQSYMLFYTQKVDNKPRIKPTPAPQPTVSLEINDEQQQQENDMDDITNTEHEMDEVQQSNNEDEDEEKATLAKAILDAKNKPKVENNAAIIVQHDDTMDNKRSKLDALIERESTQGTSQKAKDQLLTKATHSQFYDAVGRWDEQGDEDMGTSVSAEKERVTLLQQMKTKRKKTDLYDLDYDRGKVKKIKEKRQDKFGKPNLFQAKADDAAEKKNKKKLGKKGKN